MTVYNLLILQIIAHLLADFTFQSKEWVIGKRKDGFSSWALFYHALVVLVISFLLSDQFSFMWFSVIIAFSHWVIDGVKNSVKDYKFAFFIDQFLHLVIIAAMVFTYNHYFLLKPIIDLSFNTHHLLIIAGYLVCTKPANILIRKILDLFNSTLVNEETTELLNAGKLIGTLERFLILSLLLFSQFTAVGFLITAKSILRYEGVKTSKTEYVLIGTLLSFSIAFLMYMIINQIKFY